MTPAGSRVLDDTAWFGAPMGTAATAAVLAGNPGRVATLADPLRVGAVLLLAGSVVAFVGLALRDFGVRGLGRGLPARMRSPVSGAAHATIPGSLNVVAVAALVLWPAVTSTVAGWVTVAALAGIGTSLALWLTLEFFVSAFEHPGVEARDISGVWFIPETVVLLGALLISDLARAGPVQLQRSLTVVAFALLGAGALLFLFTAMMFVNRLVLHAHDRATGAPAVWIMISPLSVTGLALQSVARDASLLGSAWSDALYEIAGFVSAMLWGFALWWIAVVAVLTRHAGRAAFTRTAADWAFVFPMAAMVIATLTLGRYWDSALVEGIAVVLALLLLAFWSAVVAGSVRLLAGERRARRAE